MVKIPTGDLRLRRPPSRLWSRCHPRPPFMNEPHRYCEHRAERAAAYLWLRARIGAETSCGWWLTELAP